MCEHNHTDIQLSCGCHNIAADMLIPLAANRAEPDDWQPPGHPVGPAAEALLVHTDDGEGTIRPVTGGDADATVEAFAAVKGKIVAVGALAEVRETLARQAPNAEVTEVALTSGQCVTPGLIEPHVHIVPSAIMLGFNDYTPFGDKPLGDPDPSKPMESQRLRADYTLETLKTVLQADVANVKGDEWLLGNGVDTSLMGRPPAPADGKTLLNELNVTYLDDVSKTKPILLVSASMHTIYANTAALTKTWDHDKSGALKEKYGTCDEYIKQTDGVLQEIPMMTPALEAIDLKQKGDLAAEVDKNLHHFFDVARRRGVTLLFDAGMQPAMADVLGLYVKTYGRYYTPMRVGMAHLVESKDDFKDVGTFSLPTEPTVDMTGSIDFYYGAVKLVTDGSNQGLTGFQSEPYACPPEHHYGLYNYYQDGAPQYSAPPVDPPDEIVDLVQDIWKNGWPAMVHANGDLAINYCLEAYEKVVWNADPDAFRKRRNRVEHCSLLNDSRLERLTEIGLTPSFLIGHVGYWGYAFESYIFENKAKEQLDRCGSIAAKNLPFTLHSDCSVSPLGPLRMMEQAVTRKMEGAKGVTPESHPRDVPVLNPDERVTPAEALCAATFNAAWQCHADHLVGSLEVGKLADFVVLAKDPLTLDAEITAFMTMRDIRVEQVWVGSRKTVDMAAA